jgi:hypothetical protein
VFSSGKKVSVSNQKAAVPGRFARRSLPENFFKRVMSDKKRDVKRQVVTNIRALNSVWKKQLCDTFLNLNIVPEKFTGKLVISFKDGGISFIEKTETFK